MLSWHAVHFGLAELRGKRNTSESPPLAAVLSLEGRSLAAPALWVGLAVDGPAGKGQAVQGDFISKLAEQEVSPTGKPLSMESEISFQKPKPATRGSSVGAPGLRATLPRTLVPCGAFTHARSRHPQAVLWGPGQDPGGRPLPARG